MKNSIIRSLAMVSIFVLFASSALAGALEDLAGKWTLTRTDESGQVITQAIEITKNKFKFRIWDSDKKTLLYAQGTVKVETLNALNSISFVEIEYGTPPDDLKPVDDDRQCVYVLSGDTFTLALDFDKDRGKSPRTEVYTRAQK